MAKNPLFRQTKLMNTWPRLQRIWRWIGFPSLTIALFVLSLRLTVFSVPFMDRVWVDLNIEQLAVEVVPAVLTNKLGNQPIPAEAEQKLKLDLTGAFRDHPLTNLFQKADSAFIPWLGGHTTNLEGIYPGSSLKTPIITSWTAITKTTLAATPLCSAVQTDNCQPPGLNQTDLVQSNINDLLRQPLGQQLTSDTPFRDLIPDRIMAPLGLVRHGWQLLRLLGIVLGILLFGLFVSTLVVMRQNLAIPLRHLGRLLLFHMVPYLVIYLIIRFFLPDILNAFVRQLGSFPFALSPELGKSISVATNHFVDVAIFINGTFALLGLVMLLTSIVLKRLQPTPSPSATTQPVTNH